MNGTALLGHAFAYNFDTIGNRMTSTANGATSTYTIDSAGLNQYANRTVPNTFDITGQADPTASVMVNLTPAERQGDLFHAQLSVNNTSNPVWQPISVVAAKPGAGAAGTDAIQKQTGNVFIAKTPEAFTYDFDGNMTSDGKWLYTWDAENRLVSMETQPTAATAGTLRQKLDFVYDAGGRRLQKKVAIWNTTNNSYQPKSDTRFICDGWNLLTELNGISGNAVVRSYVWGLDLSGSMQGAGGVGGLLALTSSGSTYSPSYDGNGNVNSLTNAADGSASASFEYDPFGSLIKATGAAAYECAYGFSTKYTDQESALVYYGYRYYSCSFGRWLNRDRIAERGGVNLFAAARNNLQGNLDRSGLNTFSTVASELVNAAEQAGELILMRAAVAEETALIAI